MQSLGPTLTAPTPPIADNSTKVATTAFVKAQGYALGLTCTSVTAAGTVQTAASTYYTVDRSIGAITFNPPASPSLGDLVIISVRGSSSNVPRFAATVLNTSGGTDTFFDFGGNGIVYFHWNGTYWDWN